MIDEEITKGRQLTKGHWQGQSDPSVQVIEEPENHSKHIQNRKAPGRSGGDSSMLSIVELHPRIKQGHFPLATFCMERRQHFFLGHYLVILQLADEDSEWGVNEERNVCD